MKQQFVIRRDVWDADGERHRAGKVVTFEVNDDVLEMLEKGLIRRLKDEDEVRQVDETGNEKIVKKAGEPVKRKRGRPRKNARS